MIRRTSIVYAILAVRKEQDGQHPQVTLSNENLDTLQWLDGNPTNITNEQILAKQEELRAQFIAEKYQRDRTELPEEGGYPSVGDQLDMLFHDKKDDTTTWEDAVQAIKDAHPKP